MTFAGILTLVGDFDICGLYKVYREKKGKKLLAMRGLELPTFGSTEQCFTNDATNKALQSMVHWRNKA